MTELDKIIEQQLNNYKLAINEIIINNTNSLYEDDILYLIDKPPLDSMDVIKVKILSVAKKEEIVIDSNYMNNIIDNYRKNLSNDLKFIKRLRIKKLTTDIDSFNPQKDYEIIKITKKQLSEINKLINNKMKKLISDAIEQLLVSNISNIYSIDESSEKYVKIYKELSKYLKNVYKKQLIENINIKILVKDTILINSVREQGERYLFTKNNSRVNLLNED